MKKLIFLCLPLALLYACSDKSHKTDLIVDKTGEGLEITHVLDTFNTFKGQYYVSAMIKNNSKDKVENFLVTAKYIDQVGDIVAETSNGAGHPLAAGDSILIENTYAFSSKKDLPYQVKISVKDMFK